MNDNIQDIAIFSRIDERDSDTIRGLFSSIQCKTGTVILEHGKPVDGLYLLEEGEVAVSIPGFEGVLATLGPRSSFGELSLFNADNVASATVKVTSETALLDFCPRDALVAAVSNDDRLAAGFYHGCALLVAERLRSTNDKIGGEIAKSIRSARALIEEVANSGNLGLTQQEIQTAGSHIVSGMTDILKRLLVMKQKGGAITHSEIGKLADDAKAIYYSEFQIFDKVNKELKVLGQHLENVTRILNQQELLEVEGDLSFFDLS